MTSHYSLLGLPNELLTLVLCALDSKSLVRVQSVSRRMQNLSIFIIKRRIRETFGPRGTTHNGVVINPRNHGLLFESYTEFRGWQPPAPEWMVAEYLGTWRLDQPRPAWTLEGKGEADKIKSFEIDVMDLSQLYCHFIPYRDDEICFSSKAKMPSPSKIPRILQPSVVGLEPFILASSIRGAKRCRPKFLNPIFSLEKTEISAEWLKKAADVTTSVARNNAEYRNEKEVRRTSFSAGDAERTLWFGPNKTAGIICCVQPHDGIKIRPPARKHFKLSNLDMVEYVIYYESLIINPLRVMVTLEQHSEYHSTLSDKDRKALAVLGY